MSLFRRALTINAAVLVLAALVLALSPATVSPTVTPQEWIVLAIGTEGTSSDPGIAAIVAFARQMLAAPAEIADADVERLRAHGYRDEQIAEVAGLVGLQLLTGSFNLIAGLHAPAEALAELTSPAGG